MAVGAVAAATAIFGMVGKINDANKRRWFAQALSLLTNEQKIELNKRLIEATTQNERIAIVTEGITEFTAQNEAAAASKKIMMLFIAGGLSIVLLTVAVIYYFKRK